MSDDINARLIALEIKEQQRHEDMVQLRDAVRELYKAVTELNRWQSQLKMPLTIAGIFFIAIVTAAGAAAWSGVKRLMGI